ncbi:MAG TPA: exopolysaccharide biosynthesis polyprenyl glycosylphosphotransferase [Solirubrobacterales bacterium]|nr:exopolysaccharide biosynthesis polyprenyl glycosylphosphotransferase [Solirubrobacterales bacterium]
MTSKAQETASRTAPPAQAPGDGPRGGRTSAATRLGLAGASGARRRGSVLRRMLATGDWLTLVGTLCIVTAASPETNVGTLFWATMFSPVWILVLKLHGLYDNDHRRIRHSTLDEISSLISAAALGTLALDGLLALSPVGPLAPSSAIAVGLGALLGNFASRAVFRFFWHRLAGAASGIVIGPAPAVAVVARRVATHPETRLHLVGYLEPRDEHAAPGTSGLPRLGSVADISRVARERAIERVIVTEQEMSEPAAERLIEECKAAGLALTFLPQHFGLLGPGIELNRLAELPVLDFRFSDPPRSTVALKRAMDLAIGSALLLLISPLLALLALLVLIDSGRPVLFRQRRVGKDGRAFTVLKFRTMVKGAEEQLGELVDLDKLDEPAFKIADDPRITRSGRLLRRYSFDELPQLLNVVRGEMSLVGPRPEEEAVVALYDERQRLRLAVKPGMTGPMQVYGRADLTFEERLAMERDYLDNISVAGDLAILLRTPAAIVRGDGAY